MHYIIASLSLMLSSVMVTEQWELCSSIHLKVYQGQVLKSSRGKLDEEIPDPSFLADPSHCVKVVANHIFSIVNESRAQLSGCTKVDAIRLKKYWGYMIKKNSKKQLKTRVRQLRFLLNTCLTIMKILVQSGGSRQDHQNKERHTIK